jgi:hypothetical protein
MSFSRFLRDNVTLLGMAAPLYRKIGRWILDHLLWDTIGTNKESARPWVWPTGRLLLAVIAAALLTWWEWVLHHPPEIAIIALIHFVFVLLAIGLVVHVGRWFRRSDKRSPGRWTLRGD